MNMVTIRDVELFNVMSSIEQRMDPLQDLIILATVHVTISVVITRLTIGTGTAHAAIINLDSFLMLQ